MTLIDLLLLGAPEGKTELIEDRVLRAVAASHPDDARRWFATLAREAWAACHSPPLDPRGKGDHDQPSGPVGTGTRAGCGRSPSSVARRRAGWNSLPPVRRDRGPGGRERADRARRPPRRGQEHVRHGPRP